MPASAPATFRRVVLAAVLALTPSACAGQGDGWGSQPADSTQYGKALPMGASGLGNYLAALHAQSQHQGAAAADFYGQALARDPDNVELLQRAFALMTAEGRMDKAAELARRLTTYDPNATLAGMLLAVRDAKAGDFAGAERRIQALPKRGINAFIGPLVVAWARVGQNRIDEALEVLSPLANNSHLATLHDFHAGLITDLAARTTVAEEHYRNTVATPAGLTVRAVQAVGSFYQRLGRLEKARALYEEYLRNHPDSALFDGAALLGLGKEAPRVAGNAIEGLAEAMFGAATTVRQSNAPEVAMMFARMALELRPDFPLVQVLLADILQSQGRLADANAIYRIVPREAPVWWPAQLRLATNMEEMGDVEGAAQLLRQLAQARPDRTDALVALGEILRKRERFAEAALAYDAALARVPRIDSRHWSLFYSRGISLERSDQWQRAESDFLKALELEPDQPLVLNYLGYSWVEKGINLPEARRMIEKAVELRPNDGYIVDSLGWVLYRLGEYDKAVRQLERAVELRPDDPTINDHLGDALARVGRLDEARFQWQRTLNLSTDQKLLEAVRAKLATSGGGAKTAAETGR